MDRQETLDFLNANAETYTFLSQMLFKELNEEAIAALAASEWPQDTGNERLDHGYYLLRRYFAFSNASERRRQLAVEYARIFLAAGVFQSKKSTAVPYESVFVGEERLVMGEARDAVVRWFAEDGFAVDPDLHEPEDHIAFELEYLATMSTRAASLLEENDAEAFVGNLRRQVRFIDEHLLNWVAQLRGCAADFAKTTFYIGMLEVAEGALQQSRALLVAIGTQAQAELSA